MRHIDTIIVHCSATPENRNVLTEIIRDWHILDRGWSDIGYHYVIELDGTIEEGRPIERVGAHAKGHNRGSVGICYVGGVDSQMNAKDTRTPQQKESLEMIIKDLICEHPIKTIIGHCDVSNKACPSFDAKAEYSNMLKKC